jgi:hypothetical protein
LHYSKIDQLVELLQKNHSLSVTVHAHQLKDLHHAETKYSNRKKIELPDSTEEKQETNVLQMELEAEALMLELELLAA